jgi:glyoxylase-like metal-dependent hydrolase (beta-lactamase superfamily II)
MVSTQIRGIHRVGDDVVNVYLVEESGLVTIVDAGVPGYWKLLPAALAEMGRSLEDVRAILLTHGHSDHVGFAERARSEKAWPVLIHEADAALARGEVPNPAKGAGMPIHVRPLVSFLFFGLRNGGLRQHALKEVSTFGDGATLDVPGSPRVILLPGHTPGMAALYLADRQALLIGDGMATYSVATGQHGPHIAAFSADRAQALDSLSRIEWLDATYVLPGHGPIWDGGVGEAVARVRDAEKPAPKD